MDSIIGICGNDFVLIAADSNVVLKPLKLIRNKDKLTEIDGDKILAASGDLAGCGLFSEFIKRNAHLQRFKNRGRALTPSGLANFARMELSIALRKKPYMVNLLIGGVNKTTNKAELFWLDFFGTLNPTKIAAQGDGADLIMSILDQVDVNVSLSTANSQSFSGSVTGNSFNATE